jgi:hypothetical protein
MPMGEDPNQRGGSRKWIVCEVGNSLRQLGTADYSAYSAATPPAKGRSFAGGRR